MKGSKAQERGQRELRVVRDLPAKEGSVGEWEEYSQQRNSEALMCLGAGRWWGGKRGGQEGRAGGSHLPHMFKTIART